MSSDLESTVSAVLFFICCCCSTFAGAQTVYSCGGFLKSQVPIPFDKILIKLYTPEGNLKYETDCAPNNGYYMIPVYAKGSYAIRVVPPNGWVFEPETIELNVDGETDACSTGQDLNFEFKGFAVNGRVVSGEGAKGGPANFAVALSVVEDGGEKKKVVQTTQTTDGGSFHFTAVLPGEYVVSEAGELSDVCVGTGKVGVSVKSDRAEIASPLVISGYTVSGSVANDGRPLAGVTLSLYGKKATKLSSCPDKISKPAKTSADLPSDHLFLCSVKSTSDGKFHFPCVPSGFYSMVPRYSVGSVQFDLSPSVQPVTVSSGPVKLQTPFVVRGFAVAGRAFLSKLGPVPAAGATVTVNGKKAAVTDQKGDYSLTGVVSGDYRIQVEMADVEFDPVQVNLSPTNVAVPEVVAKRFNMCGSVKYDNIPTTLSTRLDHRTLLLTDKGKGADTMSLKTDKEGKFCKMVPAGKYQLVEKEAGVSFVPPSIDVDVTKGPVKNVAFSQFEAKISGAVQCIGPCRRVVVKLLDQTDKLLKELVLSAGQPLQTYEFGGLLPGMFKVTASADGYCWDRDSHLTKVGATDVQGINFGQTGFVAEVVTTNDAKLVWTITGSKVVTGQESLKSGSNRFCLPVAGKYELKLESCHRFDKEVYYYNTESSRQLIMTAVKHKVTGSVALPEATSTPLHVKIRSSSDPANPTLVGPLSSNTVGKEASASYAFELFADHLSTIDISPVSSLYLFNPPTIQLQIGDSCHFDAAQFIGERGKFLDGQIMPSLAGVEVTLRHNTDEGLVFNAKSDSAGKFRIGPLRNLDNFDLLGDKFGYVLTAGKQFGQLNAFKLAELVVSAVDSDGGKPLEGVLISLSGGVNYRSNNLTDATGSIAFIGLSPGSYFVRPVLKEYSFEPQTKTVEMKEGQKVEVDLKGKRVAFSVFGRVRHLAGQPVGQTAVEAVSEGCNQLQEEDTTTDEGSFRIRGLQPGCSYRLSVKQRGQSLSGAYPSYYDIEKRPSEVEISKSSYLALPLIMLLVALGYNYARVHPLAEDLLGRLLVGWSRGGGRGGGGGNGGGSAGSAPASAAFSDDVEFDFGSQPGKRRQKSRKI